MDTKELFGLRLQALRKERGLSQERLAELIDRSKDAVSKMERGINLPAFDTLVRLAEQLGVSLRDLVGDIDAADMTAEQIELQAKLAAIIGELDVRTLEVLVEQAAALRRLAPTPAKRPPVKSR